MEKIAGILFASYTAFYVVMIVLYFFNPKPLKKTMQYSTIGFIVLIVLLIVALWVDGSLFKEVQVHTYF